MIKVRPILYLWIIFVGLFLFGGWAAGEEVKWWGWDGNRTAITPEWKILEESSEYLIAEVVLHGFYYQSVETPQGSFFRIYLNPGRSSSRSPVGWPELPVLARLIALPEGKRGFLQVEEVDWIPVGQWRIFPRQFPQRDDGKTPPPFEYLPEAYQSTNVMPLDPDFVTAPQGWMGVAVATLSLTPLQYIPATQELKVARRLKFKVVFTPGGLIPVKPLNSTHRSKEVFTHALLNPRQLSDRAPLRDENEPVRMLFVMKEEALETMMPLVDFHHQSGLRSQVWIVEGNESPQEIKDHIRELFQQGLEFVLFVGDAYINRYDIPMYHWDQVDPGRRLPPGEQTDAYSDSWYVCLDPPQDGYDDHYPDLAIGRLVYDGFNQIAQLQTQVSKTLGYLAGDFVRDNHSWIQRAILVAHNEFRNGVYTYVPCKQRIREYDYPLPTPQFLAAFGNINGIRNRTIYTAVNDTGVGFLNYRGHGLETTWDVWNNAGELWSTANVRNLTNENKPFIAVLSACLNNNIARWAGSCMGEVFQKSSGGSFAVHGSTESSFTDGNTFFDEQIFQAWFDDGIYSIGYANSMAIGNMVAEFDAQGQNGWPVIGRFNARCYIWLGDPAVEYRLGEPFEVRMEHPELLPIGTRTVEVRVESEGEVSGVRITAWGEDEETYVTTLTNQQGIAVLEFGEGLPGPQHLYLSAYHRNSFLEIDTVLVASGLGVIEGTVFAQVDSQPIENASVVLSRFNVRAQTQRGGSFRMEGIPENIYTLTASAPGWLSQEREVEVAEEETTRVEFYLTYAQLEVSPQEIELTLNRGERVSTDIGMRNSGDGPLTWYAQLGLPPIEDSLQRVEELLASLEVNDSRLLGVVFVDGNFYISGGNENADPNYIYVLNRQGRMVGRWQQPEGAVGVGIRQLAWDGEYLYGSSGSAIFQMTLEGEVVGRFFGPYDPNMAITVDDEGYLWVGYDRSPLRKIDRRGEVLATIPHNLPVRALAWFPESQDGYSLLLLVQPPQGIHLYQMNPNTGLYRFLADLAQEEGEVPSYGLHLTPEWDGVHWSLVGIVGVDRIKKLVIWDYAPLTNWIDIAPTNGMIEPGERAVLRVVLDAHNLVGGLNYQQNIQILNNGREPVVEVPVMLRVNPVSVEGDKSALLPLNYSIQALYPQPFNSQLFVQVAIPQSDILILTLYDLQGRSLFYTTYGMKRQGVHRLAIDGQRLTSGVYLLEVRTPKRVIGLRKVILLR